MTATPPRVVTRLLTNTEVQGDCIISLYSAGSHGYSQIGWQQGDNRYMRLGHRVAWEAANGPVPKGLTVDHICHVRKCINPNHLRLLSNEENARDNGQGLKVACPQGHYYTEENTYMSATAGRVCRACAAQRRKASR